MAILQDPRPDASQEGPLIIMGILIMPVSWYIRAISGVISVVY